MAALNAGRDAQSNVVSCSAPGECAGGGFYTDRGGHTQAFVVDERKGVWGVAREVPGSAALNTGGAIAVNAISCASAGRCAVGGSYNDGAAAWIADEAGGVWGHAQELAGALNDGGVAAVTSISCVRPGYCAAGGIVGVAVDSGENAVLGGFVASEAHGTWTAFGVAQAATVSSISCGSAGNCVAGGSAEFAPGDYIVTETSGTWGSAQPLPGTGTLSGISPEVTSVSCEPSGCDAVGTTAYCLPVSCTTQTPGGNGVGFGVTETGGTWGGAWGNAVALPLPVPAPSAHIDWLVPQSLSCTSPGDCAATGGNGARRGQCPAWYRSTPARSARSLRCPARRPATARPSPCTGTTAERTPRSCPRPAAGGEPRSRCRARQGRP